MSINSAIEWTESTWNPLTGCTKISRGCQNCYAERFALRLQAAGNPSYKNGFKLTMHERMVNLPITWRKPQTIFVNSMSDLFHEDVPEQFIFTIFEVMNRAPWHRFQVLTKRAERLQNLSQRLTWTPNIWMGVTVEDQGYTFRIDHLRNTGAATKFLSLEPLISEIPDLNLEQIDWVIVGGESGPKSRPIEERWVANIRDKCLETAVPFFFKQWGGTNKKKAGRELEGRTWSEMPGARTLL